MDAEAVGEPKPWTATEARTLHENPYFRVLRRDVRVNDGSAREYFTIEFPGPAVGIVATRGDEVLLVRQYRFIVDEFVWAIPSGGTARGEELEAAARRELEEETGYRARSIRPLMRCYASYGCSDQRFEIFQTDDVEPTGGTHDPNEVLETRWFGRRDLIELIERNGVVDNLSLSPLLLVLLRGERNGRDG